MAGTESTNHPSFTQRSLEEFVKSVEHTRAALLPSSSSSYEANEWAIAFQSLAPQRWMDLWKFQEYRCELNVTKTSKHLCLRDVCECLFSASQGEAGQGSREPYHQDFWKPTHSSESEL